MDRFKIAAGSVPGTDHTKPNQPVWKNNQDAAHFYEGSNFLVGVVCDGCGGVNFGENHSELGARLGAQLVVKAAADLLELGISLKTHAEVLLERLASQVANNLHAVARMSASSQYDLYSFTNTHLLFTIMGVIITEDTTMVFSFGDGVYAVNGDVSVIPPYPENQPPYIVYRFLPADIDPSSVRFEVRAQLPTADVQSVLIGSDGLVDFINAAEMPLPMTDTPLGPLSQFWEKDAFITNPDVIRRRLAQVNREHVDDKLIKGGLLHDDTTLLLVRRI